MASLAQWVNSCPGVGDGQGGLVCCGAWGRKESDTTERLNWTELNCSLYKLIVLTVFGQKVLCFLNLRADIWDYNLHYFLLLSMYERPVFYFVSFYSWSPFTLSFTVTLILMCFIRVLSYVCVCECSFALCIYFKCLMWKNLLFLHLDNFVQNGSTSREREEKSLDKLEDSKKQKDWMGNRGDDMYLYKFASRKWIGSRNLMHCPQIIFKNTRS